MPSSGMACLISATRRGGAIGRAQSSVPCVMCSAICRDMYAKYLHLASPGELLRHLSQALCKGAVYVAPSHQLLRNVLLQIMQRTRKDSGSRAPLCHRAERQKHFRGHIGGSGLRAAARFVEGEHDELLHLAMSRDVARDL